MNTLSPSYCSSRTHRYRQRGVGLLEVMIAVLVLGIGVLGVMALQTVALRNTDSSAINSQATIQIYAMFDLLRANNNKKAGGTSNLSAFETTDWASASSSSSVGTLDHWLTSLEQTLGPDAQGKVNCSEGKYGKKVIRDSDGSISYPDGENENASCTVGVKWNDSRAGGEEEVILELEILL